MLRSLFRHIYWCACEKQPGDVIGICALRKFYQDHKTIEILYALLPEHWGEGIASEYEGIQESEKDDLDETKVLIVNIVEKLKEKGGY